MKKLLLLLGYLLLNFNSFSQITIAQWNFDGSTAVPTTTATNATATNATYGAGITTAATYPGGNPSTGKAISNTGWNVTAIDLTKYLEVTITPNINWAINFNDFKFDSFRSSTGATTWAIRTSSDNFGVNVASGAVNTTFSTNTVSLSGASFQNISTQFKLRIYGFGASGSGGTFRIDNITFTGTIANTLPTLTATPTTIPAFNYVAGSGPSTSGSYTISGSVLTPTAGDVTVTAPTNFEVSTTSATTGFANSLLVPYIGGALGNTTVYARLKAGLAIGSNYAGNITHGGGGVTTAPTVALTGSVTSVAPPVITTTGTLTPFYTIVGTPSTSQSYTVAGNDLVSDITITAPTDFEIKTGTGTYANTLTLMQSSGSVPTTTIDARLKGTTVGSFTGQNITNVSTTASANIPVNGTVGASCGVATNIATVRGLVPPVASNTGGTTYYTVTGTIIATLGTSKLYVQDATGGIAVFSTNVVSSNNLAVGDQVTLSGIPVRFNGEAQLNGPITNPSPLTRGPIPCITKISTGTAPAPVVFNSNTPPSGIDLNTFLTNNEGSLIKVISANVASAGTFVTSTNYTVITCNTQGGTEIRVDAGSESLIGSTIPTATQDITAVVGRFINTTGTDKLQIFPRNASDLSNSTTTCTVSGGCGVTAFTDSPTQLDVFNWNIEWIGHPTNGPSQSGTNDATQIANARTVLNGVGADVYMLQEMCQYNPTNPTDNTTVFGKLVEGLNTTFGANTYSGECSSAVSSSVVDPNAQRVCIIYKNSVVTKVFSRPMFDGFTPTSYPPTGTPSQFWASGRKPFMFMAKVNINSQLDTILFVGLHAKANSTAAAITDYNRRKFDVRAMYDTLQAQYPNRKTLVLGDLNDDVDKSVVSSTVNGQLISTYAPFLYANPNETAINGTRPNADWNPISKTLSDAFCASTAGFPDYIDHQIISNEMSGTTGSGYKYVPASVTSFRPIVTNYSTTTSDHYPTIARFQYVASVPATITSVATTGNWSSPATWDCNCVPTSASDVVINTGHTVTVDTASQAKSLNVKGILNWIATFTLSLGM